MVKLLICTNKKTLEYILDVTDSELSEFDSCLYKPDDSWLYIESENCKSAVSIKDIIGILYVNTKHKNDYPCVIEFNSCSDSLAFRCDNSDFINELVSKPEPIIKLSNKYNTLLIRKNKLLSVSCYLNNIAPSKSKPPKITLDSFDDVDILSNDAGKINDDINNN